VLQVRFSARASKTLAPVLAGFPPEAPVLPVPLAGFPPDLPLAFSLALIVFWIEWLQVGGKSSVFLRGKSSGYGLATG
jgi:hypothetical protein